MKLISILAIAALAIPCCAQSRSRAEVFTAHDVAAQLQTLAQTAKASGSSGATLGDYTSHAIRLSVRRASGGAEIHAHYDDIFVVTQGKATLITGGTVINPKTESNGETKGSGIQGGTARTIAKGDIAHVPAGTPHQLKIAAGDMFSAIVIKVKE